MISEAGVHSSDDKARGETRGENLGTIEYLAYT